MNRLFLAVLAATLATYSPAAQTQSGCNTVSTLSGGLRGCGRSGERARIEIRQCVASGGLRLMAFSANSSRPVVVDTGHDFVVQSMMRDNVAVIETGGGTTNRVFVIRYHDGIPELLLKQNTKASARITTKPDRIDVVIPGIWKGGDPALARSFRSETFHVALDESQLGPVCN
jgi:hypothetical protein